MADAKLAAIAAEDIGRTALGIFRRGDKFIGKTVSIAGEHLTGLEFAKAFTKAFGEEVAYRPYTHDQFRSFPFFFAIETANISILCRSRRLLHRCARPEGNT